VEPKTKSKIFQLRTKCDRCGRDNDRVLQSSDNLSALCQRCLEECPICFQGARPDFMGFCSQEHLDDALADPSG
jgi:hypothetical protein